MIEEKVSVLVQTHAGSIALFNQHHTTKLIQLMIVLQDLRSAGKKPTALFKTFTVTDLAAILRQFTEYRDKKANTLQVKISEINKELDRNVPAIEKLAKALQDFFFT